MYYSTVLIFVKVKKGFSSPSFMMSLENVVFYKHSDNITLLRLYNYIWPYLGIYLFVHKARHSL